ncbi:hypothetical protein [Streptomyces longwoodensis]|uniref:hypothetical protein n=1 Tax=Streptomyces longwoodensis TaxID=68231 RepID=UPI0033EC16DD
MTALEVTSEANPLAPARRSPCTFKETVQVPGLFLHHESRVRAARETGRVDGDTVTLSASLAKARRRHRSGQLPAPVRLVVVLSEGTGPAEDAVPAALV